MRLLPRWAVAMATAAAVVAVPIAQARPEPSGRPVRVLVGFAPGGTSDILARLVAREIGPLLGKGVIVMNRPGANGNIAAAEAARSAPDGTTLYMGSLNNPVNQAANRKLPFDFMRDFAPVALVAYVPNVLIVSKASSAKSVRELLELARREPGALSFASSGAGSSQHMAGELFKSMGGVDLVHVAYTGSAPAITDLIGGHIDLMFDNMPTALVQIRGDTVRALAVTGARRAALLPDVPTVAEAGLPGFEVTSFFALYAPAGTPGPVVQAFNAAVNKALTNPELQRRFALQGAEAAPETAQQLRALTESEVAKWREVIRAAHVVLE